MSAGSDVTAELDELLRLWRWKVRGVTFAAVGGALGLVGGGVAGFVPLIGPAVALPTILALAAGIAEWTARAIVPLPGPPPAEPVETGGGAPEGELPTAVEQTSVREAAGKMTELVAREALAELMASSDIGPGLRAYGRGCVVLAKGGPGAPVWLSVSGLVLTALAFVPFLGFLLGPGLAAGALATVMRRPLPLLLDAYAPAQETEEEAEATAAVDDPDRPDGKRILQQLRSSPIYRGQDRVVKELPGAPMAVGDALELLQRRYPRLTAEELRARGVTSLTKAQGDALLKVLEAEPTAQTLHSTDVVMVGWPGSGRSTLCNLLTLAAVLHREGSVHCISTESPERRASPMLGDAASASTRHPSRQFREWVEGTPYADKVQEAYADREDSSLKLSESPDVIFTDVRMLADQILGKAAGDARSLIQRLRFVIIDHPNRLPREDLVRLDRLHQGRVRLALLLLGLLFGHGCRGDRCGYGRRDLPVAGPRIAR